MLHRVPVVARRRLAHLGLSLGCALGVASFGQAAGFSGDLTELSIEELDALSISAASKRAQPLFETPAAVSVLLPVDVQRAGHSSIAEALRLVPGVHVAQQIPGRWNIGVRGFNGLMSTKLLVLVDGRSVYAPFYGSVEWVNADVHLDELASVEVVRGPGATLWGANAVNGVINVISKDARDTQGAVVTLRGGTGEAAEAHVRYGGQLGDRTWYRVFVTANDTEYAVGAMHADPLAQYRTTRAGVRTDSDLSDRFTLTWQAEHLATNRVFAGDRGTSRVHGLLGRLVGRDVAGGDLRLQMYLDHNRGRTYSRFSEGAGVDSFPIGLNDETTNLDLDLTHSFSTGERHTVTWGGGFRLTKSEVMPSPGLGLAQPARDQWLFNGFVQDEIRFLQDRLRLTLGSKLEHHDFIGWQPQPNVRLTWLPNSEYMFWASVAHAVRAPSRAEREVKISFAARPVPGVPFPVGAELAGNPDFEEERNTAYEVGWRWRPTPRFQTDLTAYGFEYDAIRSVSSWTTLEFTPAPVLIQHSTTANDGKVSTYGAEASAQWRVGDRWELGGGLAYAQMDEHDLSDNPITATDYALPAWIGHVRSWWELPRDFEFSVAAYGTSRNALVGQPGRIRLDGQIGWRPRPDLALTLGVSDAADPRHEEANTGPLVPTLEKRRSVFLRVQWRY